MTTFTLPWPPAVNNLYMNVGKRRIRTLRYDRWLADASAAMFEQRPQRVHGPFHVRIVLQRPDRRRRDLDGLAKAVLDALVKQGVIEDDSHAETLSLAWGAQLPAKPGCAVVTVTPAHPSLAVAA